MSGAGKRPRRRELISADAQRLKAFKVPPQDRLLAAVAEARRKREELDWRVAQELTFASEHIGCL